MSTDAAATHVRKAHTPVKRLNRVTVEFFAVTVACIQPPEENKYCPTLEKSGGCARMDVWGGDRTMKCLLFLG